LTDVLTRIPEHKINRINDLLPWRYIQAAMLSRRAGAYLKPAGTSPCTVETQLRKPAELVKALSGRCRQREHRVMVTTSYEYLGNVGLVAATDHER
jgi:hypothetical protein